MLNAEKYKDKIKELEYRIAVDTEGQLMKCEKCSKCAFSANNCPNDGLGYACTRRVVKWLTSEYKEPVKPTNLELELLEFWDDRGYKYLARDLSDTLFLYSEKPIKKDEVWASMYGHNLLYDFNDLFRFVKWEDEVPTSIKDVLADCEVVDDD